MASNDANEVIERIAAILWRCFVVSIACMLFSWAIYRLTGDSAHSIYGWLVDVTAEDFQQIVLSGYLQLKILSVVLFLFPFLGIKWYLYSQKTSRLHETSPEK